MSDSLTNINCELRMDGMAKHMVNLCNYTYIYILVRLKTVDFK